MKAEDSVVTKTHLSCCGGWYYTVGFACIKVTLLEFVLFRLKIQVYGFSVYVSVHFVMPERSYYKGDLWLYGLSVVWSSSLSEDCD